jgi:hypothetical protein
MLAIDLCGVSDTVDLRGVSDTVDLRGVSDTIDVSMIRPRAIIVAVMSFGVADAPVMLATISLSTAFSTSGVLLMAEMAAAMDRSTVASMPGVTDCAVMPPPRNEPIPPYASEVTVAADMVAMILRSTCAAMSATSLAARMLLTKDRAIVIPMVDVAVSAATDAARLIWPDISWEMSGVTDAAAIFAESSLMDVATMAEVVLSAVTAAARCRVVDATAAGVVDTPAILARRERDAV